MSGTIPTWNAMTRICGPTSLPFSTGPAKPIFKATSSTTTARTSSPTRSGSLDARDATSPSRPVGKYDLSFELSEPEAYRRDVPNAEVHVLEAGHFALDTAADEIAALVRGFVGSSR